MSIVESVHAGPRGRPFLGELPSEWAKSCAGLCQLLRDANGVELHRGLFRVFGVGHDCHGRDILAWNRAPWREFYDLPQSTLIWGENVFGDQYGVDSMTGGQVIVRCEGGAIEPIESRTLTLLLESMLQTPERWVEVDLARSAFAVGLTPTHAEHLSFALPLVCGGASDVSNLELMNGEAHLELLGQLIRQSAALPEGTRIARFEPG